MINRKTALICLVLIALMLAAAALRFTATPDVAIPAVRNRPALSPLMLFVFPASSTLLVGILYLTRPRAGADLTKYLPWQRWGGLVAICYCSGLLLLQAIPVARSLGFHVPWGIGSAIAVAMGVMALLAINQMPKLPWIDRGLRPGGDLGPVYGPRFLRIQSRIMILFLIAVFAFAFVAPRTIGLGVVPYILGAAALLIIESIAWRWHLGRKWRLERSAHEARP